VPAHTLVETRELFTNFYTFEGVVRALNGVSLVVNQGETYGLVGESGCGKSVSVRSMMRIVQAPGRIDSGKILMFLNSEDRRKGIEIVHRTEAYMQSIRGCDISMIFQEPGAALNPVLSISEQIAESYQFHRMDSMLKETIAAVRAEGEKLPRSSPVRLWKGMQAALFSRELEGIRRSDLRVQKIDNELYLLEDRDDPEALARKSDLNRTRDRIRARDAASAIARRVPLLRMYRLRLRATIRGHVVELLRSLGIANPENVARRYPHELSGGMQQRIVIAIALACHPTLLIADEPTSNLDVTIQAQIVDLIKVLKKTIISSVLFITHEIFRMGRAPVRVGEDVFTVITRGLRMAEISGGLFDPTVGPILDLWKQAQDADRLPTDDQITQARALVGAVHTRRRPGSCLPGAPEATESRNGSPGPGRMSGCRTPRTGCLSGTHPLHSHLGHDPCSTNHARNSSHPDSARQVSARGRRGIPSTRWSPAAVEAIRRVAPAGRGSRCRRRPPRPALPATSLTGNPRAAVRSGRLWP